MLSRQFALYLVVLPANVSHGFLEFRFRITLAGKAIPLKFLPRGQFSLNTERIYIKKHRGFLNNKNNGILLRCCHNICGPPHYRSHWHKGQDAAKLARTTTAFQSSSGANTTLRP
uniref:Putative secreted protein n=1 Tax=Amblyomma triste TaxID=251400 RepID=A0A023G0K1_AMBTT